MDTTEQEDRLFASWGGGRPAFYRDGVMDPRRYWASATRLLFLLKEANAPSDPRGDLRRWLREGDDVEWPREIRRSRTWPNVARWAAAVRRMELEPSRPPRWEEYDRRADGTLRRELWSVAAVNLKKAPGGGSTSDAELRALPDREWDFTAEQVGLYRPHIVVLCGPTVAQLARNRLAPFRGLDWAHSRAGLLHARTGEGALVIAWNHPARRVDNRMLAAPLVATTHEAHFAPRAFGPG